MKLITEEVASVKFVTEGKGASKKMYIEGVFLQGGITVSYTHLTLPTTPYV